MNGIGAVLLMVLIAVVIIIIFITMMYWLFGINWDACESVGLGVYQCYEHPIRYSLSEVLHMEWEWIIAHKVI